MCLKIWCDEESWKFWELNKAFDTMISSDLKTHVNLNI